MRPWMASSLKLLAMTGLPKGIEKRPARPINIAALLLIATLSRPAATTIRKRRVLAGAEAVDAARSDP
jgi:hypothetical protein